MVKSSRVDGFDLCDKTKKIDSMGEILKSTISTMRTLKLGVVSSSSYLNLYEIQYCSSSTTYSFNKKTKANKLNKR